MPDTSADTPSEKHLKVITNFDYTPNTRSIFNPDYPIKGVLLTFVEKDGIIKYGNLPALKIEDEEAFYIYSMGEYEDKNGDNMVYNSRISKFNTR